MCNICTMIHILYIHMCVELMKFQHRFPSERLSCEPRFLCDFLSSWWVEYDAVKKILEKDLEFQGQGQFCFTNLHRFGGVESHYGGFYICLFYIDPVQMNFPVKTYQDIFMSLCYGSKHPLRLLRFYYCNIGTNTSVKFTSYFGTFQTLENGKFTSFIACSIHRNERVIPSHVYILKSIRIIQPFGILYRI